MKLWKTLIRIWLALASLISFLVGWITLAHAPKPNQFQPSSISAAPELDPVPSIDQLIRRSDDSPRSLIQPSRAQRSPLLRSGGS